MPTISVFFGISIRMYYDDHAPPHFHAYYGEHAASFAIETLELREGSLPARATSMVLEWAAQHRDELRDDWSRAMRHEALRKIDPLA